MRKTGYNILITMTVLLCSMSLISCEAIRAQNITSNGLNSGMNGGQWINNNQWMNGGQRMNGGTRGNGNLNGGITNANLTGKVISVNGNSIKIEVMEQQSQGGFPGSTSEMKTTGVEKTLTVDVDVNITQQQGMRQNRNNNSAPVLKVSDLKAGQIIMIWYKTGTETVERIGVEQS